MRIETKHLLLRNFIEKDINDAVEYLGDKEVMYFIEDPYSKQQSVDFIKKYGTIAEPLVYALVEKETQKVIGHIIFHPFYDKRIYELGWIIGKKQQKKGYAYEISKALMEYGFFELKLHKIVTQTIEGNEKSLSLMRKLGMVQEGVLRKQNLHHGQWVDEYWFGILAHEWESSGDKNNKRR